MIQDKDIKIKINKHHKLLEDMKAKNRMLLKELTNKKKCVIARAKALFTKANVVEHNPTPKKV